MGNDNKIAFSSSKELAKHKFVSKQRKSNGYVSEHVSIETKVRNRVSEIESYCQRENIDFRIPVLALGTFERVGSNWFLSTISQHAHTHNEPFKQQLTTTSTLSPKSTHLADVSSNQNVEDSFGDYWLQTFVTSKYGSVNHVVKETSLFFAINNFLSLFPDAKVLILNREPAGIISSLLRQDLFKRWEYQDLYNHLASCTQQVAWGDFRFIFEKPLTNQEHVNELVALSRLIFLNCLLLSYFTRDRVTEELSYELSVQNRPETLTFLSEKIYPGFAFIDKINTPEKSTESAHGIFDTNKTKLKLEANLTEEDERIISAELHRLTEIALRYFDSNIVAKTKDLLCTDKSQYTLVGRRTDSASKYEKQEQKSSEAAPIEYLPDPKFNELRWRSTLVTNNEFCAFLNMLHEQNIVNRTGSGQMYFNENMIEERGGRIHFDSEAQKYVVTSGYNEHPVYWVTWIGAITFALYHSARLPTRAEIATLVQNSTVNLGKVNAGHRHHDVEQRDARHVVRGKISDVVGNLAVWCSDGRNQSEGNPQPTLRYIYGTAWNRPATLEEINKNHARPLIGNSRGVGIRLVQDALMKEIEKEELLKIIKQAYDVFFAEDITPKEKENLAISLLTSSIRKHSA